MRLRRPRILARASAAAGDRAARFLLGIAGSSTILGELREWRGSPGGDKRGRSGLVVVQQHPDAVEIKRVWADPRHAGGGWGGVRLQTKVMHRPSVPESGVAYRRERGEHLWRASRPVRVIATVLAVTAVVLSVPYVLVGIIYVAVVVLPGPPPPKTVYTDTAADARCSVQPEIRGTTTTVEVPLQRSEWGMTLDRTWYVVGIEAIRPSNAIVTTKSFIGTDALGVVQFDVRPLNPDRPYSLDGIDIRLTSRGDDLWESFRLAVATRDGQCDVGVGSEIPPPSDS